MNCRHLNKIICSSKNFKCISTYPKISSEQLCSCFYRNGDGPNVQNIKLIPKQPAPKIAADKYHDSLQQARISKRILALQRRSMGLDEVSLITDRLQNLMVTPQSSRIPLSTKNKMHRHVHRKHMSNRSLANSGSSSRSSFSRRSHALLQKVMMSKVGQNTQQKRFKSTGTFLYDEPDEDEYGKIKDEYQYFKEPNTDETDDHSDEVTGPLSASHPLVDIEKMQSDVQESLVAARAMRNQLEDFTYRIRDNLTKINGSLKEKLTNIDKKAHTDPYENDYSYLYETEEPEGRRAHGIDLALMPIDRISPIEAMNEHSKNLNFDPGNSIITRATKPSMAVHLRFGEMFDAQESSREYKRPVTDAADVTNDLMLMPDRRMMNYRYAHKPKHILNIETKNAADEDGVYYASRLHRRPEWV